MVRQSVTSKHGGLSGLSPRTVDRMAYFLFIYWRWHSNRLFVFKQDTKFVLLIYEFAEECSVCGMKQGKLSAWETTRSVTEILRWANSNITIQPFRCVKSSLDKVPDQNEWFSLFFFLIWWICLLTSPHWHKSTHRSTNSNDGFSK